MKVLLIVPSFNEAENIKRVYDDLMYVSDICDYIFINDCSTDNTIEILEKYKYKHINLPINLGLAGAVQLGYKYAYLNNYDAVIQFDGDGQHQAKYIGRMIAKMSEGNDIVIGSRFVNEKKDYSIRMVGSRLLSLLIKIKTGVRVNDPTSGMRMLNREMMLDYAYNMNRKPEPDTLSYQIKRGAKISEIQVDMNERVAGESIFNPIASIKYMVKMTISILFFT